MYTTLKVLYKMNVTIIEISFKINVTINVINKLNVTIKVYMLVR